jgi:hypothetical protein
MLCLIGMPAVLPRRFSGVVASSLRLLIARREARQARQ